MSSQEAEPFRVNAEIHGLESRRTTPEVYAAFYNLYAGPAYQDGDGVESSILLGPRVVHIDETQDRSQHLVVRIKEGTRYFQSRRERNGDEVRHYLPYEASGFIVATTDGTGIERWRVQDVHGVHEGLIDGICNQYQPEKETIHMSVVSESGNKQKLTFNMATGLGNVNFGQGSLGWILSDLESAHERQRIVPPTEEQVARLGHLAVVS